MTIICPFCNKPYTAEMEEELMNASGATSPSGYGACAHVIIKITCTNCGKLVYQKDTVIKS